MSRKKTNKTFESGSKAVGLRMGLEMIDKWDRIALDLDVSKALIIESALHHFFTLTKPQQKELLKIYLTRNI